MTVDQLVQASIYAMARRDPNGADFFAVTGDVDAMYPLYWKDIVEYYSAKHFKWVDGEDVADYAGPGVIELALSPSQMNAAAQAAPTTSPDALMVMDRSKYWPQFTRVVQEINAKDDVTLFSLCEATGHCGTRFAWAIVGDANVASDMWRFVSKINMHTPRDVQLRVSIVLDIVLARMRTDTCMFRAAAAQMAARWTRLEALFASSPSGPLKLMGRPEGTTPAYATLTCDAAGTSFTPTEEDIAALLGSNGFAASANTLPMRGCGAYLLYRAGVFAHDNTDTKCAKGDYSHAFLDLTMREEDFDLLLSRLDSSIADM